MPPSAGEAIAAVAGGIVGDTTAHGRTHTADGDVDLDELAQDIERRVEELRGQVESLSARAADDPEIADELRGLRFEITNGEAALKFIAQTRADG